MDRRENRIWLVWQIAGIVSLLFALLAYGALYDYGPGKPSSLSGKTPWWDFANMWVGGQLALEGKSHVLFEPESYRAYHRSLFGEGIDDSEWSYPPNMLLWVMPLALLPIGVAYWVWHLATLSLLAVIARPLIHDIPGKWVLILGPAALSSMVLGQNGVLTAALIIGVLRYRRERAWLAGLFLGALLIKPHLAILLPFALLAERNFRVLVWASVAVTGQIALVSVLLGPAIWTEFWTVTRPLMTEINNAPFPQGYHLHAITGFALLRSMGLAIETAYLGQMIVTIACLGMIVIAFGRHGFNETGRVALICALVPLATPYGYGYDLVLLLVPLAYLMKRNGDRYLGFLLLIWSWAMLTKIIATHGVFVSPLVLAAFAGLVCWTALGETRRTGWARATA